MSADGAWDDAPCGLLLLHLDGTVVDVNATLLRWVQRERGDVVGRVRLSELLSIGGRMYWETHLSPLLLVERRLDEVALELRTPSGRRPVLITAEADDELVRVAVTGAGERTRYERELLSARRSAERSEAHVRLLQTTTAALSQALGVAAVGDALLAAALGPLGASSATVWLADDERGLVVHAAQGAAPVALPPAAALAGPVLELDEGRVVVPLHGQSALQGVLAVVASADAGAEPLDLEVLTAIGQQAGLALDRAQRYEQSASVAHSLQASLLAVAPPEDERYAVATAYRPGVEMLEVGGDWYDAFLAGEDLLSFTVGDVVGRGLGAASAMGQLRSAVRALAGSDLGPAGLLSRLDSFVEQVDAAAMATLVYAELDLARGSVRYACAGHPPPLLLPAVGPPRLLWEGRSTPLGAFVRARPRPEASVQLAPGDRLLLYTDGLVERRTRGLDEGLELLQHTATRLRGMPLAEAVRWVTELLLQDEVVRDDVCVLVLSWSGTSFEQELSADLQGLSGLRKALRGWLTEHGVGSETAADLVLAASEATANAAEHGCGGRREERVSLRAQLSQRPDTGDAVVVTVHDPGHWRESARSDERGRGMRIMRALVDDVRVETEVGTTVVLRRGLEGQVP